MTSVQILNAKPTTFCWAFVRDTCATLHRERSDARQSLDAKQEGVVVPAHNHRNITFELPQEMCSECSCPIVAWCVTRYVRLRIIDSTEQNPILSDEYQESDTEFDGHLQKLVCDIFLFSSEGSAEKMARSINEDDLSPFRTQVLPCHFGNVSE